MLLVNLLFSFQGRIPRQSFWLALIGIFGAILAAGGVMSALAGEDGKSAYDVMIVTLVMLPCAWIGLATQVKRWHDRGHSGWRVLINVIPILGPIWVLVELGILKGTAGTNQYGADPLLAVAPVTLQPAGKK